MIKVVTNFGLKMPGEVEYSSRSFHVGLEAEIADGIGGEGILVKAKELFALARAAVNVECNGKAPKPAQETAGISPTIVETRAATAKGQGNGEGNGNGDAPSSKQLNYLLSLARRNGGLAKLNGVLRDEYGIAEMNQLSRKECSQLIERMNGGAHARR
jgi:hypothetical protein